MTCGALQGAICSFYVRNRVKFKVVITGNLNALEDSHTPQHSINDACSARLGIYLQVLNK